MLLELAVRNFGIIEKITWQPSPGLNVITGETGAGKSLVVDAVEALLSGQSSDEDIRTDSSEAEIEGVFSFADGPVDERLAALLAEKEIDIEDDVLIFSCVFRRQSRTTPRVNRQAVPRALLRDIGAYLVDIHGQSNHLSLLDKDHHLDFLDAFAHTRKLRREFAEKVAELHQMDRELHDLTGKEQDFSRQMELLEFQITEIQQADLKDGEDNELETELGILTSAEKLKASAWDIYSLISGDDPDTASALNRLNDALPLLGRMLETDPSLKERYDRLEGAAYELAELAADVRSYGEGMEYDPERLEEVHARLELIRTLKRKYGSTIADILTYEETSRNELENLTFSGERKERLQAQIDTFRKDLGAMAADLSAKRKTAAGSLEKAVRKELDDLEMTGVIFKVGIAETPDPKGLPFPGGDSFAFTSNGIDDIEFMASTNLGESVKPLAKIASTGEISRFMLALKCALAEADTIPVLVFDEIDIGVGGRSGEIIGRKLHDLSRTHQVTCVTHLPQIAAFADTHYSVTKGSAGDRTVSNIRTLTDDERLTEIAVMLSGPAVSEASLNAAREIMDKAKSWKASGKK